MNVASEPLVSVVTPVYNGGKYLVECIESVLAQTYHNWEYIIVDNRSSDNTLEIASRYAQQDNRIRVMTNERFVGIIENHNIAFSHISNESSYCKALAADDYLFPEFLARLVEVAEGNPRVAILGSYAINRNGVRWLRIPPEHSLFEGREVCRLYLLGAIDAFATPSAALYRSSIVRARGSFYPGSLPNADFAACLIGLESTDFAFVHQILSYERIHGDAVSSDLHTLNGFLTDRLQFLSEYGPTYLTSDEINKRREELLRELYRYFAVAAIHLRGKDYWGYHRGRLEAFGEKISAGRLVGAVCVKAIDLLLNPKQTIERIARRGRPSPSETRAEGDCFPSPGRIHGTGV